MTSIVASADPQSTFLWVARRKWLKRLVVLLGVAAFVTWKNDNNQDPGNCDQTSAAYTANALTDSSLCFTNTITEEVLEATPPAGQTSGPVHIDIGPDGYLRIP